MDAPPLLFDRALRRRRLERAAGAFSGADFLHARAAEDAVLRLEAIMRAFPVAVELGSRTGAFRRALEASMALGRIGWLAESDLGLGMLAGRTGPRLVLDEERLPFAPESLDLLVSTLSLHVANDLPGVLAQARRALRPDGLLIATLLGGRTLTELRQALLLAETEVLGGAGPRVAPFVEVTDGARLLQRAGFALPVSDIETVPVAYPSPLALLTDLRAMGETSVLRERRPLRRDVLARAVELYAERFSRPDGKVVATFEIVTLTGWAPHSSQPQPLKPGSAQMRLEDALRPRRP
jgi:SAM-dependent methyltransferase